MKFHMT